MRTETWYFIADEDGNVLPKGGDEKYRSKRQPKSEIKIFNLKVFGYEFEDVAEEATEYFDEDVDVVSATISIDFS